MKSNTPNYCIGFTTKKGLMLDLDNISYAGVKRLADYYLETHKLEGYLILKTSRKNFHLIFNRYLSWRKIMQIIFKTHKATAWAIWQAKKGELTLRISKKKLHPRPKIIRQKGQTDKLINDYLLIYKMFEEY